MIFFEFTPSLPHLPNAACRDIENPDLFFPESRAQERRSLQAIRSICDGCIERKECLDYALKEQIPYGIWAGFGWEQRKRMIGNARQRSPIPTRAHLVRKMFSEGVQPKEIAKALEIELSYVTQVLIRAKAKLEGEIQSQLTDEKPGEESSLSSGFPQ